MTKNILKALKDVGFKAYMRKPTDTWVIFTNGRNIGYAQESRGGFVSISTLHRPQKNIGSGFGLNSISDLSRHNLEKAFQFAPQWVSKGDLPFVKKWDCIEEYINSSSFNKDYKEVE